MKSLYRFLGVIFGILILVIVTSACRSAAEENANKKFCSIAKTSMEKRTEVEINEYYEQLKSVAPQQIKAYVATLQIGWKEVIVDHGQAERGRLTDIERPKEVSEASRKLSKYVRDNCGTEASGVYLVFPERGY